MTYQLHHGDCISIMPLIERESIDAIVTDPPYGLVEPRSGANGYSPRTEAQKEARRGGFMGKLWDSGVPGMHFWLEALRCAKPGAYLLAFGGTRTFHRLAVAIEDAGWEIRDTVMWVYGQGFPKSHDVSKAIDREAGAEREVIGKKIGRDGANRNPANHIAAMAQNAYGDYETSSWAQPITSPATPAAAEWDGWGTALKPAWEPIIVARKPLQGTVAENVQRYGTGAMNIDGCRIESIDDTTTRHNSSSSSYMTGLIGSQQPLQDRYITGSTQGRWPANLIHDGSAEVLAGFPMTSSNSGIPFISNRNQGVFKNGLRATEYEGFYGDTGSAARFFYCAKASKQDRDEGCEDVPLRNGGSNNKGYVEDVARGIDRNRPTANHHPTVKPTALMRYLCRLVTPPNGTILDPFMGSGSTGKAAILEGFNFIGIDTEIEYVEIAARRIEHACEKVGIVVEQPMMFETQREKADKPKQMLLL